MAGQSESTGKPELKVDLPYSDSFFKFYNEYEEWDTTALYKPTDITTALQNADSGWLEQAADICDAQLRDDRILGTLQTRINAVLGLNNDSKLEFSAKNEKISKAIYEDWWISAPEEELRSLCRWGYHLGIGFAHRSTVKENGRWIPRIKTWHPRNFEREYNTGIWKVRTRDNGVVEIDPNDSRWVIFTPYGSSRPWANGSWLPCGMLWLIKLYCIRDWQKYNALHGSGSVVGKAPRSASKADINTFWTKIKSIGRNARIVLPEGYELETLEANGKTYETFPRSIEIADKGIAIIHLGQPMTTDIPGSAQTGSDNARAVRQDYLEFDAETLASWAHNVHLQAWAKWNFGDTSLAPWPVYNSTPPTNLQLESATLAALGKAVADLNTVAPPGHVVDTKELFSRYNIPIRKETVKEKLDRENTKNALESAQNSMAEDSEDSNKSDEKSKDKK